MESRNHEMISRKITYPISDFPSRSTVMESSKKINGAEPVLWNQECENFDLLQKKTSGKEAKWWRCIVEVQYYSVIGLLSFHNTSNGLIRYVNWPLGIRTGKGFKDKDVYKDVGDEWIVFLSADSELVHGSSSKLRLQNERGLWALSRISRIEMMRGTKMHKQSQQ